MKKVYLKTLLLAATLLGGVNVAWADDITSLPFTTDFATAISPFDAGVIETSNTNIGAVLNVCNTTATAWFDTDASTEGRQAYELGEKETVTLQFTAFHGWYATTKPATFQLLNSDGASLVEYTYECSGSVTDVKLGGTTPTTFSAFTGNSKYDATRNANGIGGNGKPYVATENYNPTITMTVSGKGYVTFSFVSANAEKSFSATLEDVKMDLARFVIKDEIGLADRATCIDNLSITSAVAQKESYSYTINYVDETGASILTDGGMGEEGTTVEISQEVLVVDGKKYDYVSDDAADKVLNANGTVITVRYKEKAKKSYTVNAVNGEDILKELAAGSCYEDETPRVYYSRSMQINGQWYTVAPNSADPIYGVDLTEGGNVEVAYEADDAILYFFEGNELNGSSPWAAGTGAPAKMSNGDASRMAKDKFVYTEPLAAGDYVVTIRVRNQRSAASTETFASLALRDVEGTTTALDENFAEWTNNTLEERTITITVPEDNLALQINNGAYNSNLEIDYIVFESTTKYLQSSANLEGFKTFYDATASYEVDESTTIYQAVAADDETVTLQKVDGNVVPADIPVVLQSSASDYAIALTPTDAESKADFSKNLLKAAAGTETGKYVLAYRAGDGLGLAFYQYIGNSPLEAGDVYLDIEEDEAAPRRIVIAGEATAIKNVNVAAEDGAVYNVAGQKVNGSYKGIVIKNGKKFLQK